MFQLDENLGSQAIQYSFKDGQKTYKGNYKVCESPTCGCFNFNITFNKCNELTLQPQIELGLDLEKRAVSKATDGNDNRQFASLLIQDLTDPDWHALVQLFMKIKAYYIEHTDLMTLDVTFPLDEIERDGQLVSYYQIFPFAEIISLNINNKQLFVEDFYCVLPFCHCQDAHLYFQFYDKDINFFPFFHEHSPETHIIYNIKRDKWHLEGKNNLKIDHKILMAAFSRAYNIHDIYKIRYDRIRKIYKHYRSQFVTTFAMDPNDRVGRNDPCQCGSGKKYKKCCLGKKS